MIEFVLAAQASPTVESFASDRFRREPAIGQAIMTTEPNPDDLQVFPLRQKFLGLGKSWNALRFLKPPVLSFDVSLQAVTVKGWDIKVENSNQGLASITREMGRKFLRLWQDAEKGRLTAGDKETWFHIVANVDMDAFHRSLERPRYLEGQLAGSSQQWLMRWPGEEGSTKIPKQFSSQFSLYNREEWVGAHFLLDQDDKIVGVERVVPIPAPNYDELENWPPAAS